MEGLGICGAIPNPSSYIQIQRLSLAVSTKFFIRIPATQALNRFTALNCALHMLQMEMLAGDSSGSAVVSTLRFDTQIRVWGMEFRAYCSKS